MMDAADPAATAKPGRDAINLIGKSPLFGAGDPGGAKFNLPDEGAPVCDVVMKGGVTSGVVYPYAILRLAQDFRFAGIGGTSAGAMAAALAAAAEYARQARGDHLSFSRFEARCMALPGLLPKLFQPHPRHRWAFRVATAAMEAFDRGMTAGARWAALGRILGSAVTATFVLGAVAGGVVSALRYVWYYGRHEGRAPDTAMNPGLAAALTAGGVGLLSAVAGGVLFALAVKQTKRWPLIVYLLAAIAAAVISIKEPLGGLYAVIAPAWLGGGFGAIVACIFLGDRLIDGLRRTRFGFCPGLRLPGAKTPAVTDWLHEAIQDVAGRPNGAPLTFGDIEGAVPPNRGPKIALRMITTNMAQRRPFALPDFGGPKSGIAWIPAEWRELFPAVVIDHMTASDPPHLADDDPRPLPPGSQLPIIVGARMSLSFPILFSGVPVYRWNTNQSAAKARETLKGDLDARRMLLVDGGLSSNMPLHFFDSLGPPAYPTFAFNLDTDARLARRRVSRLRRIVVAAARPLDPARPRRRGEPQALYRLRQRLAMLRARPAVRMLDERKRISLHKPRQAPPSLTAYATLKFGDYLSGLLGAAKDWQDNLLSIMPGQFDRIVGIRLAPDEGGLNLVMPPARSRFLMRLGYYAGDELALNFDLQAHRVRRALAAYQEIERVAEAFQRSWMNAGLHNALTAAQAPFGSRRAWRGARADILLRFGQLAVWAQGLTPPVRNASFPRPRGALRITPNLSGDQ